LINYNLNQGGFDVYHVFTFLEKRKKISEKRESFALSTFTQIKILQVNKLELIKCII
jgi:hypothetical protein